ncbi:GHKL domain-containing protein [Arthrobacter humicola]|uniref:GHKL domain-containing protein n=1 Tax=Arthrobacter humicola TaxID=409291 RepID=UPI001FAE0E0E|nr:GHKL domain-containing protein [Arthrobacter humicola]MCI9870515.1 sensor histidine kinase [Arthrobacter humicola]
MTAETPDELQGLGSTAPSNRARAAGWLIQHPQAITTRALMNALQTETVPQVRRLLLQVLESRQRLSDTMRGGSSAALQATDVPARSNATAPEHVDVAALVRHELSPAVGWIRLAADSEIESFGTSKTNDAVRKLQRRIDGLVAIIKSNEELNLHRLSLPHILSENWPDTRTAPTVAPSADEASLDIETDEGLFSMLLSNVFQNAIDASIEATGKPAAQITWGFTDQSYWVRVTNPFKGDRFALADVVDVGSSSKMAHQGQGLSLIKTVAARLGLSITLDGVSGTASFSLSGPRPHG